MLKGENNMPVASPQLPKTLNMTADFSAYAQSFLSEERTITGIEACDQQLEGIGLRGLEVRKSVFRKCAFLDCSIEAAGFADILFEDCDFSNSRFIDAYFERCRFVSCRCIGADLCGSIIKQTAFEGTNLQYASFNKARLTDVAFVTVDFTSASMSEAKLKRFEAVSSKFIRNNFFRTILAGVDFTENEFAAPTLSAPPAELYGAVINAFQAAELISSWGIVVKY